MSSLIKVPLLLVAAKTLQVAMTSPNATAKRTSEERTKYERRHKTKELLPMPIWWGPIAYRTIGYAIIFLEICTISLSESHNILGTSPLGRFAARSEILQGASRTYISLPFLMGILLSIFGASIRASCYRHMGRHFTFELTLQKDHQLVTSGPYSIVRHPSYLGIFSFYLGTLLSLFGAGSFYQVADLWKYPAAMLAGSFYIGYSVYVGIVLFARVGREDKVLREEFKDQWASWAKKTPYKLIPYVY